MNRGESKAGFCQGEIDRSNCDQTAGIANASAEIYLRTKRSDLLARHAASPTTRRGRNCQDGGVREIRIDPAVRRAARCGSLTLLAASESTIARASIVVALQAIPVLASYDRGDASCDDGRRRREGKKGVRIFLSHIEVPQLTLGPTVRRRCEPAHIGGCKFLRSTAQIGKEACQARATKSSDNPTYLLGRERFCEVCGWGDVEDGSISEVRDVTLRRRQK